MKVLLILPTFTATFCAHGAGLQLSNNTTWVFEAWKNVKFNKRKKNPVSFHQYVYKYYYNWFFFFFVSTKLFVYLQRTRYSLKQSSLLADPNRNIWTKCVCGKSFDTQITWHMILQGNHHGRVNEIDINLSAEYLSRQHDFSPASQNIFLSVAMTFTSNYNYEMSSFPTKRR